MSPLTNGLTITPALTGADLNTNSVDAVYSGTGLAANTLTYRAFTTASANSFFIKTSKIFFEKKEPLQQTVLQKLNSHVQKNVIRFVSLTLNTHTKIN